MGRLCPPTAPSSRAASSRAASTRAASSRVNDSGHLQGTSEGFQTSISDRKLPDKLTSFGECFDAWGLTFNLNWVFLSGAEPPTAWTFQTPHPPIILRPPHLQAGPHLGFSEEELQVSAAQNAVVLYVAGNVHSAGAVHGAVHLHVVMDGVQVFLFILKQKQRLSLKFNKDGQIVKNTFSFRLWWGTERFHTVASVSNGAENSWWAKIRMKEHPPTKAEQTPPLESITAAGLIQSCNHHHNHPNPKAYWFSRFCCSATLILITQKRLACAKARTFKIFGSFNTRTAHNIWNVDQLNISLVRVNGQSIYFSHSKEVKQHLQGSPRKQVNGMDGNNGAAWQHDKTALFYIYKIIRNYRNIFNVLNISKQGNTWFSISCWNGAMKEQHPSSRTLETPKRLCWRWKTRCPKDQDVLQIRTS